MKLLDDELKETIEIHTILSDEYLKCPLSTQDLRFFASAFAEVLRARLRECLEAGERRNAEPLILELQASMAGIAQPLQARLQKAIIAERRLFKREWNLLHPPQPRELSSSEAYEKMLRSMGHGRSQ